MNEVELTEDIHQYPIKPKRRNVSESGYDYCVIITTYNRPWMLKTLLDDVFRNCKDKNVKVVVFDDGTEAYIDLKEYDLQLVRYQKNNGKANFWKVIDDTFKYVKNIDARYYFYLQDDVRLVDDFFEKSIEIYNSIDDPSKISLGTLIVECQRDQPKWTGFVPEKFDRYYKTQWCELFFVAEKKLFEVLEYKMMQVNKNRWKYEPTLGSGVGKQISLRLQSLGYNMYHVVNSLVEHDDHESVMNPLDRQTVKLIAKHDNI